jgi:prevent-host-death family protein
VRRVCLAVIKPISDLRNRANQISRLCHQDDRPVFITRNGQSDLVVMSQAHYDRLQAQLDLYRKLDEAEAQAAKGARGIGHREMIRRLRTRLR